MLFDKNEIQTVINPLVRRIKNRIKKRQTLIVGIQGGQGTGKTTVAKVMAEKLKNYKVQVFSIDDFYLSYQKREELKKKNRSNPFYSVRGMPGTHRVDFLNTTLKKIQRGENFSIPQFDKSLHQGSGDISKSIKVKGRQDVILFEGWNIGLPPYSLDELKKICRKYNISKVSLDKKYNRVMIDYTAKYQKLWSHIDYLVMLQPDSSNLHFKWRWQQEKELKKVKGMGQSFQDIKKFVSIFLPLTYLCYEKIQPDVRIFINKDHQFYRIQA